MSKTIWNPGDIITTEKWNKINNNASPILGAYQLPIEIGHGIKSMTKDGSSSFLNSYEITINKSFEEITNLLKQGIICYFYYQPEQGYNGVALARGFSDNGIIVFLDSDFFNTINFYSSYENSNVMINYDDYPEQEPTDSTVR